MEAASDISQSECAFARGGGAMSPRELSAMLHCALLTDCRDKVACLRKAAALIDQARPHRNGY